MCTQITDSFVGITNRVLRIVDGKLKKKKSIDFSLLLWYVTLSAQIVGVAKVKQFMLDSKTEIDAQYLQKYIKTKTKKLKLYRFVHVQTGSHRIALCVVPVIWPVYTI